MKLFSIGTSAMLLLASADLPDLSELEASINETVKPPENQVPKPIQDIIDRAFVDCSNGVGCAAGAKGAEW